VPPPLQQVLRHQHKAFSAFYARRARYPRYKSRRSRQSAHYTRSAFSMRAGVLRLAKTTGPLRFVWTWPEVDLTTLNPTMAVVSREPDGRWYVTFAVDTDAPEPVERTGHAVGIDLGVKDFAVTSDGERIVNPRHLLSKARNLARYQRRTARCRKGSANRARARAKVARAYRKVRNARLVSLDDACGARVRHLESSPVRSAVKQEPQPVTAGIPVLPGRE